MIIRSLIIIGMLAIAVLTSTSNTAASQFRSGSYEPAGCKPIHMDYTYSLYSPALVTDTGNGPSLVINTSKSYGYAIAHLKIKQQVWTPRNPFGDHDLKILVAHGRAPFQIQDTVGVVVYYPDTKGCAKSIEKIFKTHYSTARVTTTSELGAYYLGYFWPVGYCNEIHTYVFDGYQTDQDFVSPMIILSTPHNPLREYLTMVQAGWAVHLHNFTGIVRTYENSKDCRLNLPAYMAFYYGAQPLSVQNLAKVWPDNVRIIPIKR